MDFNLTEDQRAIQDMARDFAAAEFAPHAARWDEEKIFPVEALRSAWPASISARTSAARGWDGWRPR